MLAPGKAIRTYNFSSIEPGAHGFDDTVEFGSLYSTYFISDMWEPGDDDKLSFEEHIDKFGELSKWGYKYGRMNDRDVVDRTDEISSLKEDFYEAQKIRNSTSVNLEVSGDVIQRPNSKDNENFRSGWRPVISRTYDE